MKWILKENGMQWHKGGYSGDAVAGSGKQEFSLWLKKISLGLRKYRNHSENFAILAKLGNFARLAKFR